MATTNETRALRALRDTLLLEYQTHDGETPFAAVEAVDRALDHLGVPTQSRYPRCETPAGERDVAAAQYVLGVLTASDAVALVRAYGVAWAEERNALLGW